MKSYLFVNPASGHHSDQRLKFALEKLKSFGINPQVLHVRTPTEVYGYCDTINKTHEPHLVIVAGGDGTFNSVVNGLDPETDATLAILPFGTSNVMAAEIGITSIDDALERIAVGKTASLSVGIIELEGRTLRFVLMAGIGLDGSVVRDVWPWAKKFLRQGAYALSALKSALLWDYTRFKINSSEAEMSCHSAIICNASRYGGNFILSPECTPFGAGLSAVCVKGSTRRSYLRSALDLLKGKAGTSNNLIRMSSITFEIHGKRPIQIDGDFVGYGPAHIAELPDFARIIV